MSMVVEDYMSTYERGWLLIVKGEKIPKKDKLCGKKVIRGDTTFLVEGVVRSKCNSWWRTRAGLVLHPNNKVPDYFEIGQEVELI